MTGSASPLGPVGGRGASVFSALVLRLAVAVLPRPARKRYQEEWAADIAGAAEAGLHPSSVVLGALVSAVRLRATMSEGRTPVNTSTHPSRPAGRTLAAVAGIVLGSAAGAVVAIAAVVLAGLWVTSERQLEGALVVALPLGAVLGCAVGRAIALRALGLAAASGLVPVGLGLVGAVGSLALLGNTVPPAVLNAYGVLLLPAAVLLGIAVCAAAGETFAARHLRTAG